MSKRERGMTIVEVVIAILVLSIGVLALTSTAALVTRMVGQGERYAKASTMAHERFEMLRSSPCDAMTSDSTTIGAFSVAWVVDSIGGSISGREIHVAVTAPTPSGARTHDFSTIVACDS